MKNEREEMCRIPVRARFVSVDGGMPVMVSAEYADIPASVIAEYFARHFGIENILQGVTS